MKHINTRARARVFCCAVVPCGLMTPDELHAEKEALLAEIYDAFKGVSRDGGVSWRESVRIDSYGYLPENAESRWPDTDRAWTDLVDDPSWHPDNGVGGFTFLDAIGFRYYVGPALVRCVRDGLDCGIQSRLTIWPDPEKVGQLSASDTTRMAALEPRQCRCIARCVRFMVEWSRRHAHEFEARSWEDALDSYWYQY